MLMFFLFSIFSIIWLVVFAYMLSLSRRQQALTKVLDAMQMLMEREKVITQYPSKPLTRPILLVLSSPASKIFGGILSALVGLFIYLWASRHSPYNPLGAMMIGGLETV